LRACAVSLLLLATACSGAPASGEFVALHAGEGLREVVERLVAVHDGFVREGRTAMLLDFAVPVRDGLLTGEFLYPEAPGNAATGEARWWVFTNGAPPAFVARGNCFFTFAAESIAVAGLGTWGDGDEELRFDFTGGRAAPRVELLVPGLLAGFGPVELEITPEAVTLSGFGPTADS